MWRPRNKKDWLEVLRDGGCFLFLLATMYIALIAFGDSVYESNPRANNNNDDSYRVFLAGKK